MDSSNENGAGFLPDAVESPPPISPSARQAQRGSLHIGDVFRSIWAVCWLLMTAVTIIWDYWRSRYLLNRWAADNAFKLVRREYRILRRGPFLHHARRGHTVHYISVRDRHGELHSGFARCSGLWKALVGGAVDVKWDA